MLGMMTSDLAGAGSPAWSTPNSFPALCCRWEAYPHPPPPPPPLLSISSLEAWDTLGVGGGPFYLFWANFKCYILQSFC